MSEAAGSAERDDSGRARISGQMTDGDPPTVGDHAGQPPVDRVGQVETALGDQLEDDGRYEGLGDASRPEPPMRRDRAGGTQLGGTTGAPPDLVAIDYLGQRTHGAELDGIVQPRLQIQCERWLLRTGGQHQGTERGGDHEGTEP